MIIPQFDFSTSPDNVSQLSQLAQLAGDYKFLPSTLWAKLDPTWMPAGWLRHLSVEVVNAIVHAHTTGESCGILASAPPRHGKSRFVTTAIPTWYLEHFPQNKVAITTYGDDLSRDFTGTIRDVISQNEDLLSVRLAKNFKSVSNWRTTLNGGVFGTGVGGPLTGKGFQLIIVDDYLKNFKEASSPALLEDLMNWFLSVVRTRLEPGGVILIIATRWVVNDLHGMIMKKQKESGLSFYKLLNYPAISRPGTLDSLGREPNVPLFPQRYSLQYLENIEAELGSYFFNAMYQGNPSADTSKITDPKWFRGISRKDFFKLCEDPSRNFEAVRGFDLASTAGAGDYTSTTKLYHDLSTDTYYMAPPKRGQWGELDVLRMFEELNMQEPYDVAFHVEQEPGSSGKLLTSFLQDLAKERIVEPYPATTSKLLRASLFIAAVEQGKIVAICNTNEGAEEPWNDKLAPEWKPFMSEFDSFPSGDHDDQIDSTAIAYNTLSKKDLSQLTIGRNTGSSTFKARSFLESDALDPETAPIDLSQGTDNAGPLQRISNKLIKGLTFGRSNDSKGQIQQAKRMGIL